MKCKKLIIIFIPLIILFFVGTTYSLFQSDASFRTEDEGIAKFVFNAESLNSLNLSLVNMMPGNTGEYDFAISNNDIDTTSEVTIEYQFTIKTYHFIPLVIKLYEVEGENETFIFECDETYSRNDKNELICNSPVQSMPYSTKLLDNYRLKIEFPSEYDDLAYSDLVDFINVEVKSWQKTN